MGAYLTYAFDATGKLVHIDDVPTGKLCGCRCPHCKAPLIAKNSGEVRVHHFSHEDDHECGGAYESTLHLLAKEVLAEIGLIRLPEDTADGFPTGLVKIHDIAVERFDTHLGIKPDVEGVMENGDRLLIEFLVTHKVDDKKRNIILENHLKCIELDIKFQELKKPELKDFLVNSSLDRRWIKPVIHNGSEDATSGTGRPPFHFKIRDLLKQIFEESTLIITFPPTSGRLSPVEFNLRENGYDICEVDTKYRTIKSDLLIYSTLDPNKGYIAINIRGRRRNPDVVKKPKELFLYDLVVSSCVNEKRLLAKLSNGIVSPKEGMSIDVFGF